LACSIFAQKAVLSSIPGYQSTGKARRLMVNRAALVDRRED
jgi:hypothetical protein